MYVITNRNLIEDGKGLGRFGDRPSAEGPNELRLVHVQRSGKGYKVDVMDDELEAAEVAAIAEEFELELPPGRQYASLRAAADVVRTARSRKRNVLLFVHGFNNDMEAVIERALGLEQTYGVQVIPFSWPANGGGVKGALDYKSDKRDARASAGALDRAIAKIQHYLRLFSESNRKKSWEKAVRKYGDQPEARDALYAELVEKSCPFTLNLMAHSMGNYLFKNLLLSGNSEGAGLVFDNVVLVAADTNNADHLRWVDAIQCRGRVYVTINEDDSALAASRAKSGAEQLARLGHYLGDLHSRRARYVNFTGASWVRSSHAYFEGMPTRNDSVKKFFVDALNGRRAEGGLRYDGAGNFFQVS